MIIQRYRLLELRHKIIRMYYKIKNKHTYNVVSTFKPFISIVSNNDFTYDIYFNKKFLFKSKSFLDFPYDGNDIAIIGCGPSINTLNLKELCKLNCILLNGAIFISSKYDVNVLAYTFIDRKVIGKRFEIIKAIPNGAKLIVNLEVVRCIAERDINFFKDKEIYISQDILEPTHEVDEFFDEKKLEAEKKNFSKNLNYGYIDGKTVMTTAMQFAYRLNPKNIYLAGLDLTDTNHFYDDKRNHVKTFFGKPYEDYIYPFMKSAAVIFKEKGINVYNLSKKTRLPYDVFPYSDIFEGKE